MTCKDIGEQCGDAVCTEGLQCDHVSMTCMEPDDIGKCGESKCEEGEYCDVESSTCKKLEEGERCGDIFCSDREYIIARRIWQAGNTYYCVTKVWL